ncbi:hypothetical protein N657DRAFT_636162 [Parathielavia appendiculata]|uniref:Uncharacterized protein n=1 Tax=Parathielavia appendiculata TaxID=2587402 RepID=A0AAN6Z0C0_9PEZI|nr:hypothetical protein N657DRAFT_636162 [Parathielavia appendiculata]
MTQHLILNTAQRVLKECCFEFAKASMPLVLEKKWDCPTVVELTQWTKIFRKNKKMNIQKTELDAGGFLGLPTMVSSLRHTAVHRLATTARDVGRLLESGVKLALVLGDNAMELNKNVLEDTTAFRLREIQEKREELDRMEAEQIRKMLNDDVNNKLLIGQQLENSVRAIFDRKKDGPDQGKKEDDEDSGGGGGIGCDTDGDREKEAQAD